MTDELENVKELEGGAEGANGADGTGGEGNREPLSERVV